MVLRCQRCCCCIDLRSGCLIIGYFALFSNIASLIYILVESRHLVTGNNVAEDTKIDPEKWAKYLQIEDNCKITLPMFTIAMAIVITNLIFVILLLVGLHKHKRRYVLAFLIYAVITVVIMAVGFIWNIVMAAPVVAIISCFVVLLITVYFLLVIRSYYLKMDDFVRPIVD